MRRNFLTSAAVLTTAVGLAMTLTACDGGDNSASSTPEDVVVTVTDTATRSPETTTAAPSPDPTPAATPTTSASGSGHSAQGSGSVTLNGGSTNTTQRSKIFHSSEGFEFLKTPGVVMPGGKYITSAGSACSFGWLVHSTTEAADRKYMLTAGHCGTKGDLVYTRDQRGNDTLVGEFVESTGDLLRDGSDYALIDVTDSARQAELPFEEPRFEGWVDQAWVQANNPQICRVGFRTGVSCGSYLEMKNNTIFYEGISDHGDSGGPVWAVDSNGDRWAVGVTSYGFAEDATMAGAAAIEPWMDRYSLGIYSS